MRISMSYEGKMLLDLNMPTRIEVEKALLISLFKHNGVVKEFGTGEEIVQEIADSFNLNDQQRIAFLETIYRKENRLKRVSLWHRLLFRSAASLANKELISKPSETFKLTHKKEWMLTEKGFDEALKLLNISKEQKIFLPTKSYEVQKIVKKLTESSRPKNYDPFDKEKKMIRITRESALRVRGFRQAVIEAYDYKCSFCGIKMCSPDSLQWEVEAAHIVPHSSLGKDDVLNGIALCHLHHWAFDVGWFTLLDDFTIQVSEKINSIPSDFGKVEGYNFLRTLKDNKSKILLPKRKEIYPHQTAISWHRENRFFRN